MSTKTHKPRPVWAAHAPSDWEALPIRAVLKERKEKNTKLEETNILSVMKDVGVIRYEDKGNVGNKSSDRPEAYKLVRPNDLVLNSMNLSIGSVGISRENGVTSSVYIIYQTINGVSDPNFFNYLFQTRAFQRHLASYGRGIMELRETVKERDIRNQPVVLPPLETQKRIAALLDQKTKAIDELIAKKERLIELLKEKRASLITHTITKGLDPKAKMKDSGLEWIGEIPAAWIVQKPNGLFKIIRGNCSFSKGDLKDEGKFVALQYGKTYKVDTVNEDYQFYVDDSFYKENQVVESGDVVLISTSETIEDLGHACYYDRNDIGLLGGEQMCLKPNISINGKFLYYAIHHSKIELRQYATGIKVYRFGVNALKKINIAVPPIKEQKQITDFLDTQTKKIDSVKELIAAEIERLKEYRSSLIYSAVTGKIKI